MLPDDTSINATNLQLARNALLVAGLEMGAEGDHWPVIKANIQALEQDYAALQTELAVQAELCEHVGAVIAQYETLLTDCAAPLRDKVAPHVRRLREIHTAMFSPVAAATIERLRTVPDDAAAQATDPAVTTYVPWRSATHMIATLMKDEAL
jgi:hypothetical protein